MSILFLSTRTLAQPTATNPLETIFKNIPSLILTMALRNGTGSFLSEERSQQAKQTLCSRSTRKNARSHVGRGWPSSWTL